MESIFVGIYELAAGFGILGWWALEWGGHGRAAILSYGASHIAAEAGAFVLLVVGGTLLLVGGPYSAVMVPAGLGMLLYASINALGRVGRESVRLAWVMVGEGAVTLLLIILIAFGV